MWGIEYKTQWKRKIGERCEISYEHRSEKSAMGRFGGGWNWKIGAQWANGSRAFTIIFSLLVSELRVTIMKAGK